MEYHDSRYFQNAPHHVLGSVSSADYGRDAKFRRIYSLQLWRLNLRLEKLNSAIHDSIRTNVNVGRRFLAVFALQSLALAQDDVQTSIVVDIAQHRFAFQSFIRENRAILVAPNAPLFLQLKLTDRSPLSRRTFKWREETRKFPIFNQGENRNFVFICGLFANQPIFGAACRAIAINSGWIIFVCAFRQKRVRRNLPEISAEIVIGFFVQIENADADKGETSANDKSVEPATSQIDFHER